MVLTPIHIPGKRKRDNTKAAVAARKTLNRSRGRPLKLSLNNVASEVSLGFPHTTTPEKKKTMKNLKSKLKMSDIERLPTELLERVFLYCMNIDLPKSSPIIGAKLSSPTIFGKTLIAAFGPTWEKWHGKGGQLRPSSVDVVEPLQSIILRCRWASLPIILKAKETWVQKFAKERLFKPHYFLQSQNPHEDDPEEPQRDHHETSIHTSLTATEYFEADYKGFCDFTLNHSRESIQTQYDWKVNRDVEFGVQIPQSLLSGPWTEEMVKRLFWLSKSGASINWLTSTDGEVAMDGLRSAVSAGELRVVHLLLWAGLFEKLNIDTLIWSFRTAGGDKLAVVNQLVKLGLSSLDYKEKRRVVSELEDLEDEAIQNNDQDTFNFVKGVFESLAYTPNK